MKIELLTADDELFLCDRYKISELKNAQELVDLHEKLTLDHPGFLFLLTIDDVNQAAYTSMHSRLKHDLDSLDGHDLGDLPSRCFENGEHIGYLRTKEEFKIRRANFLGKPIVPMTDVFKKDLSICDENCEEFLEANRDLLSICNDQVYCLKVPVAKNHELISAFPNGYFTCDLDPFENLALIKYLEENFGYIFVGIGASYLAFKRERGLDSEQMTKLRDLLMKIYWQEDGPLVEEYFSNFLDGVLSTKKILVLRYSE